MAQPQQNEQTEDNVALEAAIVAMADTSMTPSQLMLRQPGERVGVKNLLTERDDKAWYTKGFRAGRGKEYR